MTDTIDMYTDGACRGNPGPGGYGVVLIAGGYRKELSGGVRHTTNQRMEIMAAIVGLHALKRPSTVRLYSDSRYLVDTMTNGWALRWRARGWMRSAKDQALNSDLWGQLLDLCANHSVEFIWVRGHSGNPNNERADQLAECAAREPDLPPDEGYETPPVAPQTASLFDLPDN